MLIMCVRTLFDTVCLRHIAVCVYSVFAMASIIDQIIDPDYVDRHADDERAERQNREMAERLGFTTAPAKYNWRNLLENESLFELSINSGTGDLIIKNDTKVSHVYKIDENTIQIKNDTEDQIYVRTDPPQENEDIAHFG